MSERLPSLRARRVWQRNALTFRRVWLSNTLGHLADPLFYLAVLGWGLGAMMPPVDGMPYVLFLFAGVVAGAAMSSACFECSYGSFIRLQTQGTFNAILATPLSVADLAAGEVAWGATKGVISASATLLIGIVAGLFTPGWWILAAFAVVFVQGIFFAGMALFVASRAHGFEALNHFYALFIMPVLFLSGAFFPIDGLPQPLQWLAQLNPLTHAIHLVRPLAAGAAVADWPREVAWLAVAAAVGLLAGTIGLRRRLIV